MDSTTATTYTGRHRPKVHRIGFLAATVREQEGNRRDRQAWLFGYTYTPRHSAAHREVA